MLLWLPEPRFRGRQEPPSSPSPPDPLGSDGLALYCQTPLLCNGNVFFAYFAVRLKNLMLSIDLFALLVLPHCTGVRKRGFKLPVDISLEARDMDTQ